MWSRFSTVLYGENVSNIEGVPTESINYEGFASGGQNGKFGGALILHACREALPCYSIKLYFSTTSFLVRSLYHYKGHVIVIWRQCGLTLFLMKNLDAFKTKNQKMEMINHPGRNRKRAFDAFDGSISVDQGTRGLCSVSGCKLPQ